MSRRRKTQIFLADNGTWIHIVLLRPVQAARRERVRQQTQRVKRRAAKRWTA